ncbi:MAG: 4a-hydroxytetrahydrobiopterin dehydratase [Burkholderiales bacterium]|jgi:4a-hydroxytetrahydrobiopterin dehydratase
MVTTAELLQKKCRHLDTGLDDAQVAQYLSAVDGWSLQDGKIVKSYSFKNYYRTLAFVNALAYVVHAEDHHPELVVTYNRCTVKFNTHSVNGGRGGISENDFISAAKADTLFQQGAT